MHQFWLFCTMTKLPSIAIIFPIHNGWPDTRDCLESITKLNYPKNKLQLVIIDNGSQDDSLHKIKKYLKQKPLAVKLICNKVNVGFGKAFNQGIKAVKTKLILVTNNDLVFTKDCLKNIVQGFEIGKKIGIVSAAVFDKAYHRFNHDGFRLNPYLAYHQHDLTRANSPRECDWSLGPCFVIPKMLMEQLHGFDESYFVYFEDIDLSLRLRKLGYKIIYYPKAVAYHGYGRTIFQEKLATIFYHNFYSRFRCVFKNATLPQKITSLIFLIFIVPIYLSLRCKYNFFRPMWQGLMANLRGPRNQLR